MEENRAKGKINWDSSPFSHLKSFNNSEMEKIWKDHYLKEKLTNQNFEYKILDENDNGFNAFIQDNIDHKKVEVIFFLKYSKTFIISNNEIENKTLTIYSYDQCLYIYDHLKSNNYSLIIKQNDKTLNYKDKIFYEKDILIEAKYIDQDMNNFESFKYFTLREIMKTPEIGSEIITIEKKNYLYILMKFLWPKILKMTLKY